LRRIGQAAKVAGVADASYRILKRLIDVVVSAMALVVLAVPMLIIDILVRRESPGEAIFRQRRVGWRGRPFVMLKFRTMRSGVDPYGRSPHESGDPRLTRMGRWLRKRSLDELPQLLNVLAGQMSLVGPRPLYERQARRWSGLQRRRLEVKPGLTGYAQVGGRAALTHEEKIELDVYYVEHRSIRLDLKICGQTLVDLFRRGDNVYEQRYSRDEEYEDQG